MRRAILTLLLIITIALSASVATATDFTGSGGITDANGWKPTGQWVNNLDVGVGLTTNTSASATHAVVTGASGQFKYDVTVKLNDLSNGFTMGLITTAGNEYKLEFRSNEAWVNDVAVGSITIGAAADTHAYFSSTDGVIWHYDIDQYNGDFAASGAPETIEIGLADNAGEASPLISAVSFTSAGEPAVIVLPVANGGPSYNANTFQNFYDNIYPLIGSPYDTVTYNPDGTYTLTKGYPASSTFTVAGTVTSAADGSPIVDASVVLGDSLQKTDAFGAFKFYGVANGSADIAVSAAGFASKTQSINVNADQNLKFALDIATAGSSTVASAANETANDTTTVTNATTTNVTAEPTMAPTTAPSPTQTKSPGFEGIVAAIAMIGAAGALVYLNRKR